jgi:hypothetical protein
MDQDTLIVALLDTGRRPPRPIAVSDTPDLLSTVCDRLLVEAENKVRSAETPLDREYLRARLALLRLAIGRPEGEDL